MTIAKIGFPLACKGPSNISGNSYAPVEYSEVGKAYYMGKHFGHRGVYPKKAVPKLG